MISNTPRTLCAPSVLMGVLLAALATPASAADLVQIYRDALSNDASFAAARASRDAGLESLPQGRAGLLPTLSATAFTQTNNVDILFRGAQANSSREGNSNGLTLTLTQPLFNWASFMVYKEAGYKVAQAEATYALAQQDLIVRVAQAYFDVLAAQDTLDLTQAQKTAISEQLAQAKRNFEVGTATITDTHEAQARYDLSVSQGIAAESDLEVRQRVLQQIIGKLPDALAPLRSSLQLSVPQPSAMEKWVQTAEQQNFSVRVQEAGLEIANREIERLRSGHYPTLNMVGIMSGNSSSIAATGIVNTNTDTNSRSIGLQLAVPLYAGGSVNSQVRQAVALQEKARQDLESSRRTAALQARQSYLGVTNGMAQVRALEAALVSSQSSLDSNKLGYEVGVRINIDVLNAQQQLFSTKRDLSKARYDTLINGFKLKAAAGSLTEEDVARINALLGQ